ncbi:hypothetical protein Ocin01_09813 [Orchesella cincta]|uniref:Uncharacterized protein n=1 Tax=Orchesella cincta TaxID=48709 RepID=A0A1D2MUZ8_ORCCI|nr:hypothetical protein Ocin01_09813 [Orchesella cincta]
MLSIHRNSLIYRKSISNAPAFSAGTSLVYNGEDAKLEVHVPIEQLESLIGYQFYKPPQQESFLRKFEQLSNLNKFINLFPTSLITVNNPIGYDLEVFTYPIIVRRHVSAFVPLRLNVTHRRVYLSDLKAVPLELRNNAIKLHRNIVSCSSLLLVNNSVSFGGFCTKLKFFRFSSNSRPWNFQVVFDLFPPILGKTMKDIYKLRVEPTWLYEDIQKSKHYASFQRVISPRSYRILVLHKNAAQRKQMVVSWLAEFFFHGGNPVSPSNINTDIFLLLETQPAEILPLPSIAIIQTFSVIKLCLSCSHFDSNAVKFIRVSTSLSEIQITPQVTQGEQQVMWEFPRDNSGSVILQESLTTCKTPYELSSFSEFHSFMSQMPVSQVVEFAMISILRKILMLNATHLSYCPISYKTIKPKNICSPLRPTSCLTSATIFIQHYSPAYNYYTWGIDFPSKILRFVSCGRAAKTLGFYHLTSVFDGTVWLSIILALLLPAPFYFFLTMLQPNSTTSCIHMTSEVGYYFQPIMLNEGPIWKLKNKFQALFNYTRFLPFTPQVRKFLDEFQDWNASAYLPVYHSLQEKYMWDTLSRCNKTALVMPELNCKLFAAMLNRQEGKQDSVYVGESILLSAKIGFSFRGYVPREFLTKMNAVGDSGIAEYWRKFVTDWLTGVRINAVSKSGNNVTKFEQLEKPTMEGNVSFCLLLPLQLENPDHDDEVYNIQTLFNLSEGKAVFKQCPESSDKSTWLVFGSPQKCYVSGSKGPCSDGELLLPIKENSIQGICRLEHPTLGIFPRHQNLRRKRDTSDEYEDGDDDLAYMLSRISLNSCRSGETYSFHQRREIDDEKGFVLPIAQNLNTELELKLQNNLTES